MRALYLTDQVPLDSLALSDVPTPTPKPGEVLIRLKAAALNHRDLYIALAPEGDKGILGSDGAGVVEAIGDGVTQFAPGAEVIVNPSLGWGNREDAYDERTWSILGIPVDGTFAEYMTIGAEVVHPKPPHMTFEEAAALPLAGLTAYRALFPRGNLQAGDHVLIHAISSGTSIFALQFAKAAGAQVMGTSTHDWKLERVVPLGLDAGVNSKSVDWVQRAKEWTGGRGVDLVIDSLGGEYLARSLEALRLGGRAVNFGRTVSREVKLNVSLLFWNELSLLGTTMGSPADFAAMLEFVNLHKIKPVIDQVISFENIREAFQRMDAAEQIGKIVVRME